MADANRGNRPLSPHLTVYRQRWTGGPSIAHRITGVGLNLGALLVVWWFLAAAGEPDYFHTIDGLLTSWIGGLVLIGLAAAFCYHFLNGIRHLWWDTGHGFDLEQVKLGAAVVIVGTALLTLAILIIGWV